MILDQDEKGFDIQDQRLLQSIPYENTSDIEKSGYRNADFEFNQVMTLPQASQLSNTQATASMLSMLYHHIGYPGFISVLLPWTHCYFPEGDTLNTTIATSN